MLFDETTLRKLNRLTLVATQVRAGMIKGDRRSTKRGSSVEFADYRDYTHGDDLRRLDWNVYARLERPFIKLLEEEEDLAVHVLVDASRSMDWGVADQYKFAYALRLAAALGAIALGAGDHLTSRLLYSKAPTIQSPLQYGPTRGQAGLMRFLSFLEASRPAGATELNHSLREYALASYRPGLVFVISDLFAPGGFQQGIDQCLYRGNEVTLLHLLSPDEIEPPLAGDLRLIDIETQQAQEVSLDGDMRDLYRRRLHAWQEEISAYCQRRNVRYIPITTATPWDRFILQGLRQAGVVK